MSLPPVVNATLVSSQMKFELSFANHTHAHAPPSNLHAVAAEKPWFSRLGMGTGMICTADELPANPTYETDCA